MPSKPCPREVVSRWSSLIGCVSTSRAPAESARGSLCGLRAQAMRSVGFGNLPTARMFDLFDENGNGIVECVVGLVQCEVAVL